MDDPPRKPNLAQRHRDRLTLVRARMNILKTRLQDAATTALLAEQFLLEMTVLECEEIFLLEALQGRYPT
jgi:hypothetical protein